MATISDVCKMAGVSKATVSRVLNETGQVTEATRQKVFDAIQHLNYRPSSLARALATRKTNTIGLIVPEFEGAYYGALLKQAATSAGFYNKKLIVTDGHNDPQHENGAILLLNDHQCDAIVLYCRNMPETALDEMTRTTRSPIVTINQQFSRTAFPGVTFDQAGAAYMMTRYLIQKGHRKIACVAGELTTNTGAERLKGYRQALQESGIAYCAELVESGNNMFDGGYQACNAILSRNPSFTAVFACSDEMAVGSQKALLDAGFRIPQDKSLASIDNSTIAKYAYPPLTSVTIPIKPMTECAIQTALKLAENEPVDMSAVFVGEIVERESVAAPASP
ncbi:LacI family DNA-binding transcriptional regulator [Vibrio mangrovi]|uniref:HTH-type transcriptional regulator AscG n=1 Tax=Vibrio mangrovi TaxID=474394 RepID=A0A1Y6IVJ6_9VIBR|nr:LacI family DNA-binding transcriptional regulator [Vibrio mangrovi]MDW6004933.1 LacI family DNA-binding transcriptional regulator [Vibrio mangrovi]SMS01695.1 HTH-type transcriptional regulator AscG [Vibrio mangrovi]